VSCWFLQITVLMQFSYDLMIEGKGFNRRKDR
jgi:hypothetical protein